jgi:methylglutaconyl-CoA hydratase
MELTVAQENKIVYLTLNRPEKRNALSVELIEALKSNLKAFNEDETVRVIIIRASGEAFCAGADLAYLQKLQGNTYEENLQDSSGLAELFRIINTHPKLIIAQVEGAALAGGCGLATVCDLCYATPEAVFGYTEVKIGFIPAIVAFFLQRKIGDTRSRELLLTGKIINAEKALEINLITGVIESGKIEKEVYELAEKLSRETSPSSISLTKKLLSGMQHLSTDDAMAFAAGMNADARATEDCRKGIAAFLNKTKISW